MTNKARLFTNILMANAEQRELINSMMSFVSYEDNDESVVAILSKVATLNKALTAFPECPARGAIILMREKDGEVVYSTPFGQFKK